VSAFILQTKLFRPVLSPEIMLRQDLLQKMTNGYLQGASLTLVSAPAGYGKSTAAVSFLEKINWVSAWISLDDSDNEVQRFLTYLFEATRHFKGLTPSEIDFMLLESAFQSPVETILSWMNLLNKLTEPSILVFDDYHVISNQMIHQLIRQILDYQPPFLHLMLITREDPPLPLASYRAKGRMTEVRLKDLAFSVAETKRLLGRTGGPDFRDSEIEKLCEKTEGWIAGLQLATLLFENTSSEESVEALERFDGTDRYVIDYLVEEVLQHQEPVVREFLMQTCLCDRMNRELCQELTGRGDSEQLLKQLEKANLFLIPLDHSRSWFRYHHLFSASLKSLLSNAEKEQGNLRIAHWMAQKHLFEEATDYAMRAKDLKLATHCLEETVHDAFRYAQLGVLARWMDQLPPEQILESEVFKIRKPIIHYILGRIDEAKNYEKGFNEEILRNLSPHNRGLYQYLKAMLAAYDKQDPEAYAEDALKYLQPWDPIARVSALNALGRAQFSKSKLSQAKSTLEQAYFEGKLLGMQFATILALTNYTGCLNALGEADYALGLCKNMLQEGLKFFPEIPSYFGPLYVAMSDLTSASINRAERAEWRQLGEEQCRKISYDIVTSLKVFKTKLRESEDIPVNTYGETLSEREKEVLLLLSQGLSNREIATKLYLSLNTVQWHISHLYAKLQVKNRMQAVLKAKELHLDPH
jgi:LuxR family maltose regulon positive regulatory protein